MMDARAPMTSVTIEWHNAIAPIPAAGREEYYWYQERIQAAAIAAMGGAKPMRGPVEVHITVQYPPSSSQRKGHSWRMTEPTLNSDAKCNTPAL